MSEDDKPWTADDIRRNAPNWSLKCDGQLLEYMKNLSKTIEERGNRTNHNMQSSMLELDRTKVALENATNQLMALQHKQFIENRVYDDDETIANTDSVPTTNPSEIEEPEMSMAEAVQKAIAIAVPMVDKYFDKVTIELSDSDDDGEEVQKSVVYRPKDLYADRPLPYLIGSKEWHEKWHIGLIDEDSDASGNENADDGASISSSSSSSSHGVSISSNVPVSLSESENRSGTTSFKKQETQDLFQSSSEENISKLPHENNSSTFRKQSIDGLKIDTQNVKSIDPREVSTSNSIFRQQKAPNVSHIIPTLIDSEPPELDDVPSTKTAHKPANLFLDDENDADDIDIFADKTTKTVEKGSTNASDKESMQKKSTSINLFADDDDDDNFDSFLSNKPKATTTIETVKSPSKITNLFDDDDFEDELFLQPSEPTTAKSKPPTTIFSNAPPKKDIFSSNLFNDEPPDDDFDITTSVEKAAKTPNPTIETPKSVTSPEKPKISTTMVETKKSTDLFSNKLNLFDDDDEDDAFEKLIASNKNKKPIEKKEALFESDEEKIDPIVETETKTPEIKSKNKPNPFNPVNLFSDTPPSDDDEQLFANVSSPKNEINKKATESLKQKTEFYNDFSDTVTAPKSEASLDSTQTKSVSLEKQVSPEPAKRSSIESKTTDSSETDGPTSGKRSDFLKKLDAFSNPSSSVDNTETAPNAEKRQPKKLNIGNIDINVAALLPGAKLAKSIDKSDSLSKETVDDAPDKISDDLPPAIAISKNLSQDNVDDSGRLTNLNRNRAKNISRRPSTRAGRKQQYQKSLENEEYANESFDQIDKPDLVPTNRTNKKISITEDTIVSKMVKEDKIEVDLSLKNDTTVEQKSPQIEPKPKFEQKTSISGPKLAIDELKSPKDEPKSPKKTAIFDDELFDIDSPPEDTNFTPKKTVNTEDREIESMKTSEKIEEQIDVQDNKTKNLFSFLDDQDDDDDDFLKVQTQVTAEKIVKSEVSVKATPAYIDELPPDLDELPPVDEKSFSGKNTGASSFLSENALSLFGDDDDDDDFDSGAIFTSGKATNPPVLPSDITEVEDDWSPYPPSVNAITPSGSNEKKPASANVSSLFDDNSDNDELFGGSTAPVVPKIEPKEQKIQQKSTAPVSAVNKTSLFGDDDDDDLFGVPPPLPEPVKQTQPKKSSSKIFISDSSDDELFGGGKSNKKAPTKSNLATTSAASRAVTKDTKANDKLFSDSEDDDLFGTKSKPKDTANKKVLPASMSKTVKEDAQKPVKTLSPSATNNDPLADLLK